MKKTLKEINEVITDLQEIFELNKATEFGSSFSENVFMIDKRQFSRLEVINKLQDYFKDKNINGGYLKLYAITFIHTTFEVIQGKPY